MEGRDQGIKAYNDESAYKENTGNYSEDTTNYKPISTVITDTFFSIKQYKMPPKSNYQRIKRS